MVLCTLRGALAACCALAAAAAADYDLIVYGGTPGGIMAAVAAANESLTVLLVEPKAHVGGIAASGLGKTDTGNPTVIGGLAARFFNDVCAHAAEHEVTAGPCYNFAPHAAEATFLALLASQPKVTVTTLQTLVSVSSSGGVISSITLAASAAVERGDAVDTLATSTVTARAFVDGSYEGDLLAMAGVSFAYGREGVDQYNESIAGRLFVPNGYGDHQFYVPVNYTNSTGGLLPMIYTGDVGVPGAADQKVQAYNFRMCLTNNASNAVPIKRPSGYDPAYWELLRRFIAASNPTSLSNLMIISMVTENKTDINNSGAISTDFIGGSWDWPTATPAQRVAIYNAHVEYTQGFFWFLGNDPSVPAAIQKEMLSFGLAADEFTDNGNWPWQLYVREGRRMVGEYVFTQWDRQVNLSKPDSIGLFSYNVDTHNAQRIPQGEFVRNEGDIELFGNLGPGQMPYRSVLPKRSEATNLCVPVPMSASHVGYGAIRLEPQFMILGQSCGVAVAQALAQGVAMQDVDVPTLQARLRAVGQYIDYPIPV